MSISMGQLVPDFSAVATGDRIVRLSELRGQRLVSANKSSWWSCMDALCFSHATRFETTSLYHNQITFYPTRTLKGYSFQE